MVEELVLHHNGDKQLLSFFHLARSLSVYVWCLFYFLSFSFMRLMSFFLLFSLSISFLSLSMVKWEKRGEEGGKEGKRGGSHIINMPQHHHTLPFVSFALFAPFKEIKMLFFCCWSFELLRYKNRIIYT